MQESHYHLDKSVKSWLPVTMIVALGWGLRLFFPSLFTPKLLTYLVVATTVWPLFLLRLVLTRGPKIVLLDSAIQIGRRRVTIHYNSIINAQIVQQKTKSSTTNHLEIDHYDASGEARTIRAPLDGLNVPPSAVMTDLDERFARACGRRLRQARTTKWSAIGS